MADLLPFMFGRYVISYRYKTVLKFNPIIDVFGRYVISYRYKTKVAESCQEIKFGRYVISYKYKIFKKLSTTTTEFGEILFIVLVKYLLLFLKNKKYLAGMWISTI